MVDINTNNRLYSDFEIA